MGVALMLETARAIAAAPPKRSVLFIALTAEESGLLGSDFFVNNPTVPIDAIVANINLDMPLFLYPLADLVAFGSQHSSLQSDAESAAADEGFVFSPDPMPEELLFVRSDQYSFVRFGIPAVFLVPGFNSTNADMDGGALTRDHIKNHYHEPSDDMTRPVDWESAVRFARAHTRIGYSVANTERRPTWNEGDFFGELFGRDK
jgi:Zn-dependent M28 family amino/carboxypeptidase